MSGSATSAAPGPSRAGVQVRIGRFLFTYRNGIFPVVAATMFVFMRPVLFRGTLQSDLMLDFAGLAIAACGQILRGIVNGLAYVKRGGQNRKIAAPKLVRYGVFSLSRNPLYVGNIAIITGLVLIFHSPWAYAIVLPGFLFAYLCIVEAEEDYLRAKFGAPYEQYCAEVNRFIPTPWKLRWVNEGSHFDVRRMIRSDYSSTFYWFSLALITMAWEAVWNFGLDASRQRMAILAGFWFAGLAAWIVARILKAKKLLATPD